jgi:hypothetical protein
VTPEPVRLSGDKIVSDNVEWDAVGTLGSLRMEADNRLRFSDVKTGPLDVLVRTAMADGQQGIGQKILIGRRDYGPADIKALFERDDFPADGDPYK